MYEDIGCHGAIDLGELPASVQEKLARLPGEWLEFEPATHCIVVRHVQPSEGAPLPTIAGELVRILSEIPVDLQSDIQGGDIFVHTQEKAQLVRMRMTPGGRLHVEWAHPDYERATKRPFTGELETGIEPEKHRLNGTITLRSENAQAAAASVKDLADGFQGLYPEGDCRVAIDDAGTIAIEMTDLNLDAARLVGCLVEVAKPKTLQGWFTVNSFGQEDPPEEQIRVLFEDGQTFLQHPLLWPSPGGGS